MYIHQMSHTLSPPSPQLGLLIFVIFAIYTMTPIPLRVSCTMSLVISAFHVLLTALVASLAQPKTASQPGTFEAVDCTVALRQVRMCASFPPSLSLLISLPLPPSLPSSLSFLSSLPRSLLHTHMYVYVSTSGCEIYIYMCCTYIYLFWFPQSHQTCVQFVSMHSFVRTYSYKFSAMLLIVGFYSSPGNSQCCHPLGSEPHWSVL